MTYIEPPALTLLKHTLDERVKAWMELGIYMPERFTSSAEYKQYKELKNLGVKVKKPPAPPRQADGGMLRNLLMECAKSTGRPFVEVTEENTWDMKNAYMEITMPNDMKMAPVWAMFLPVAVEKHSALSPHTQHPVLTSTRNSGEKRFFEVRDRKIFEVWLDRVKNDPLFKKALGVLP